MSDPDVMVTVARIRADYEGTAKVTVNDDDVIEIENYAAEPVPLNSVRKVT